MAQNVFEVRRRHGNRQSHRFEEGLQVVVIIIILIIVIIILIIIIVIIKIHIIKLTLTIVIENNCPHIFRMIFDLLTELSGIILSPILD